MLSLLFQFFVEARNGGLGFAVGKWWFGLGLADLGVVVVDSMAGLADLGLGLQVSEWWWLIRWLGLRWVWLFAYLDVVVWACAVEIGLVWWLGLGLGFRCTAWWWLTAWAWAWVHGVVVVDGMVVGNGFGFLVVEPWVSAWRWWSRARFGFFFFLIL